MCHVNSLYCYFFLSCFYSIDMPYFLQKIRVNTKQNFLAVIRPVTSRHEVWNDVKFLKVYGNYIN